MSNARRLANLLAPTTGNFTSNGIDDNADATSITIDSAENIGIKTKKDKKRLAAGPAATVKNLLNRVDSSNETLLKSVDFSFENFT